MKDKITRLIFLQKEALKSAIVIMTLKYFLVAENVFGLIFSFLSRILMSMFIMSCFLIIRSNNPSRQKCLNEDIEEERVLII